MAATDTTGENSPTKVPANELIPSKLIEVTLGVTYKTVKRWEQRYNWKVWKFGHKIKRYHKPEVEKSLGVTFEQE